MGKFKINSTAAFFVIAKVDPDSAAVTGRVAAVVVIGITRFNPPPAGVIVPLTTKLPAIVVVAAASPRAIAGGPAADIGVAAANTSKLNAVALDTKSPPFTARSPLIIELLLRILNMY